MNILPQIRPPNGRCVRCESESETILLPVTPFQRLFWEFASLIIVIMQIV